MGQQHAAQTPPAQGAPADQKPDEMPVAVRSPLFLPLFLVFLLATSLAEPPRERQAASPPAANHSAADQETNELTILVALLFTALDVVFLLARRSNSPGL